MTLNAGSRLGPYEILGLLGAGGMGEVYRARDPRLSREVAVKVLPASLSADPDRLRRFEQEARAAGVLNHPNITAVYDIGQHESSPYVVSELLEGETLRSRLGGEALALRKALDYARQIALGLAAAHEKGIVHRDLKPENLFVTKDGRIKILDFGLAKLTRVEEGGAQTNLPTATAGTEPGIVLGTLGYMSPEQVRGRPADHRSDIFSFGAILYEMLSGKRAFHGDTAADTMSAILKEDPPDLSVTGKNIPPGLERIVRHCLEKNPEERFHSAHDLSFDLGALSGESGSTAILAAERARPARRFSWRATLLGAGLLAAGGLLGALAGKRFLSSGPAEPPSLRFLTHSGDDHSPAASPDGKTVAFVSGRDGTPRIWLKQLTSGNEVALTSGSDSNPRFSPDGTAVFFQRREGRASSVYRVPILGGEPRRLIEDADEGVLSPDGQRLAFLRDMTAENQRGTILGLASPDGTAERKVAEFPGKNLFSLSWSPDGRRLAAVEEVLGAVLPSAIVLLDAANGGSRTIVPARRKGMILSVVFESSGGLLYTQTDAPSVSNLSAPGRLVRQPIGRGTATTLLSFPRTLLTLGLLGEGRLVVDADATRENLRVVPLAAGASASAKSLTNGSAMDRQPVYSPDGEWVAFSSGRDGHYDLWQVSVKSGALRRLTEDTSDDWDPAFTPDGKKLLWSSNRGGHFEIWIAEADGSGARQVSRDGTDAENPTATPDGAWIAYASLSGEKKGLWKIRPDGTGAARLVSGEAIHPEVSPDGRSVLYFFSIPGKGRTLRVVSLADGRPAAFEISGLSNWRARWMPDGRAIAYLDADEKDRAGVFVQDFVPGRDTKATRRPLAGFGAVVETESFGLSPDGKAIVLAEITWGAALMLAEGVPGLAAPDSKKR